MRTILFDIENTSLIEQGPVLLEMKDGSFNVSFWTGEFFITKAVDNKVKILPDLIKAYTPIKKITERSRIEILSDLIVEYEENNRNKSYTDLDIMELRAEMATVSYRIADEELQQIGLEKNRLSYEFEEADRELTKEEGKAYSDCFANNIEKLKLSNSVADSHARKVFKKDDKYQDAYKKRNKAMLERDQITELYWLYKTRLDSAEKILNSMGRRRPSEF